MMETGISPEEPCWAAVGDRSHRDAIIETTIARKPNLFTLPPSAILAGNCSLRLNPRS